MGKTACLSNESKDNNLWNAPKSDKSLWDHITEGMRSCHLACLKA